MNRIRGKLLCRIRKQNQHWPSVVGEPDSGIPVRGEAGEDVNSKVADSYKLVRKTKQAFIPYRSLTMIVDSHGI
jgi:hypothetical protein